jgi:protein O-mannosyl-transferase
MATVATKLETAPKPSIDLFSSPGKRCAVLSLLLTLVTLVVYNPVWQNEFVSFDDPAYITSNQHVRSGLTWDTVKWAFRSTEHANWFPITRLSHALDCQVFHLRAAGHHYMTLLLHVVVVVLLFLFLERTTRYAWRSLTVAALFAVHPINVESVAWAAERKNVLCTIFFLLGILAYTRYARNPSVKRYMAVALLFALGLMSKPMVITFPFVLLLLDYWPLGRIEFSWGKERVGRTLLSASRAGEPEPRIKSQPFARLLWEKLPLLALSAASAIITLVAQRAGGAIRGEYSFASRLLNAIVCYALYIGKALWPSHLAVLYPYPENMRPAWEVVISALVILSMSAATLILRRHRYLAVGWLWYMGTLIPVIGLVQVGEQAMADRYAYIPLIGLFIAAVWGVADWARSQRLATSYLAAAAAIAITGLAIGTHLQIGYWRDTITLWSRALDVTERNFVAHDSMGAELIHQGEVQEAKAHFQAAANINPRDAFSQLDLGVCEKRQGNVKAATEHYELALRLSSDPSLRSATLGNLGSIYRISGDYGRARQSYESALGLLPDNEIALVGLALVAQKNGDLVSAINYYSRAVTVEPSDTGYLLLAQALAKAGQASEAQAAYAHAHQVSRDWNATERAVDHLLQE